MTNEEMIKDIDKQIEELKREKERLEKWSQRPALGRGMMVYSWDLETEKITEEIEKLEEMKKNYEGKK